MARYNVGDVEAGNERREPGSVGATRVLIAGLALLWLGFSLLVALNRHPSFRGDHPLRGPLAIGVLFGAAALAALIWTLARRPRMGFFAANVMLGLMLIAGLMDEVGASDLVFLAMVALPIGLLWRDRRWYLAS
jgi:hypothetical protein